VEYIAITVLVPVNEICTEGSIVKTIPETSTDPKESFVDTLEFGLPWCEYDVVAVADGSEESLDDLIIERSKEI